MINKTRKTLSLALLVLGCSAVTLTHNVEAASVDPFMDFYNRNCVPEAQKAGLSKNEAQQGCTCTINSLRKKYSSAAFTTLLGKYRSGDATANRTLRSYGETCFSGIIDDLLFEN